MKRLLNRSLNEGIAIEIIYQGKDNTFSKRSILVRAITERYIKAFCLTKRQARIFKIESILAVAPIRKKGERYYA
jgi:hypothetical protein